MLTFTEIHQQVQHHPALLFNWRITDPKLIGASASCPHKTQDTGLWRSQTGCNHLRCTLKHSISSGLQWEVVVCCCVKHSLQLQRSHVNSIESWKLIALWWMFAWPIETRQLAINRQRRQTGSWSELTEYNSAFSLRPQESRTVSISVSQLGNPGL